MLYNVIAALAVLSVLALIGAKYWQASCTKNDAERKSLQKKRARFSNLETEPGDPTPKAKAKFGKRT